MDGIYLSIYGLQILHCNNSLTLFPQQSSHIELNNDGKNNNENGIDAYDTLFSCYHFVISNATDRPGTLIMMSAVNTGWDSLGRL